MRIVIIGGVAGGASAAARARRLSEDAEIILIERGPDVSFANCGLPYHLSGKIADRNKLLVTTPERLRTRFHIDVRVRSQVESIDREAKTVSIRDLNSDREYAESYDRLILSPGASPFRPPVPGVDLPQIHTLRNLQDMDRIKQAMTGEQKTAVIIGAGFIGLELAENFHQAGLVTSIVELQSQVLPPLDPEMTTPIAYELAAKGISLYLNDSAEAFAALDRGVSVKLKSGVELNADVCVLGVGVRPENQLAVAAGLEVGPRGGIRVNEQLQTSDPDIYAVGDVIEVQDFITGDAAQIPLAGPANRQGRLAANHVFARSSRYRGTQATAVMGFFDKTAAITGASEKVLMRSETPYQTAYVHPSNHAGYYPGAEMLSLKVIFAPETGKILGAQCVGGAGVDKRIDVLSVAIQAGMTVFDLEEMELCYAPQFGSAKDPINMVGFVAAGELRGDHPQVSPSHLFEDFGDSDELLLDVRTPEEFAAGHIDEAVNIPVDELRSRLAELSTDQKIIAYCKVGQRGYIATRILLQHGFDVRNLSGGFTTYSHFAHCR